MSDLPYHEQQLKFIVDLAQNRLEFLDPFFRFLNYFDSPYFFYVLIPMIWVGFSYKWGIRIFYWFTLNNLLNSYAKYLVGWPRPSHDIPEIAMLHPHDNGFPSGAAETSMLLGGMLIYCWRTPMAWAIGSIYILLISFSRLYLGVHYPIDLLGGWILGGAVLLLFIKTKEPLEKWLSKQGLILPIFLGLAIPLLIILIVPNPKIHYFMGAAMGVSLGCYFSLKHHLFLPPPKDLNQGFLRSFISIAMLFLILFLMPGDTFAKSFTAGLFMSLAASPICKWFLKSRHN